LFRFLLSCFRSRSSGCCGCVIVIFNKICTYVKSFRFFNE
jgi:hypothetical protein